MSETPQGAGWWRASDGLWYPPETHPDYEPPAPPAGASYRPPVPPAPPASPPKQPTVASPMPSSPPLAPPKPPPPPPDTAHSRSGGVTAVILSAVVVVVLLAVLLVIGLLVGDSHDDPPVVSVEATGAPVSPEAFVTTGVRTGDGVLIFGTTDDSVAEWGEIWSDEVVTQGPGPQVLTGTIEVPLGIPYLYGAAPTDSGFIASGEVFFTDSGESQTAVFTSSDGLDWSLTAPPGSVGDASAVYDVAVVDELTLAVAVDDDLGINQMYRSDDGGVTWVLHGVIGIENATIWGIAADDDTFYAVGSTELAGGEIRPVVFSSTDGSSWTQRQFASTSDDPTGVLYDITPVDDGYLAVGSQFTAGGEDILVVYSPMGNDWKRVATPLSLDGDSPEVLYTVIPSDGGAVATGQIDDVYAFWEISVGE